MVVPCLSSREPTDVSGKAENRASRRQQPRQIPDAPAHDCVVMDMSEGGVRLCAEGADVPDDFILDLDGEAGRPCQVVWRLDAEVGAEFLD
jgi:hypothetical protein